MSIELERARKRQMLIFLLVCSAMLGLLGRLYYWQVVRSADLTHLATNEHIRNLLVNAPRGRTSSQSIMLMLMKLRTSWHG
ncbi:MAG: hypothetical protein E6J34_21010 [Chloroflexi bacterium]|nr:MAG: hypothetical protein E6J34_21010 [Chloroflexota bacterium]